MDVTARSKELLRDGLVPMICREVERRVPILCLKVDVTARCEEMFRDGLVPICGRFVERRDPFVSSW